MAGPMDFLRNNSQAFLQSGLGLLSGRTGPEQAALGAQGLAGALQNNKTVKFLQSSNPELAQAVMAGAISPGDAWKLAYQQKLEAQKPANLSFQTLPDGTYGFANPREGTFNALGRAEKPGLGAQELGLNLVWGRDENGNTVAYQPSKSGGLVPVQVDSGVQLSDPYYRARDAASGKVAGTAQGEAAAGLPGAIQKADESISMIDAMIRHPGRETATGKSSVWDPRNYMAGTDATDFNVRRRQLEGRAFLEAFESLKGGGQITEVEGRKATDAIARLDTAQSDEAYLDALMELRSILEVGKQRAAARAGTSLPSGGTQQGGNRTSSGVQWSVEP